MRSFCYDTDIMDKDTVQKLAALCRIDIADDEMEEFRKDLGSILGYVGEIDEVATGDQKSSVGKYHNVMRKDADAHESGMYTAGMVEAMPRTEKNYLKVKKIL